MARFGIFLTGTEAFRQRLSKLENVYYDEAISYLDNLAEECVEEIRSNVRQGWRDRTGNLFSSIGLALGRDGQVIKTYGFEGVGELGRREGTFLASKLVAETPKGVTLVAVAAMDYAEYMEARNVVVLTSVDEILRQHKDSLLQAVKGAIESVMR